MKIKDYTVGTAKGTDLITVSDGDTLATKNITVDDIVEASGVNGTWTTTSVDLSNADMLSLNSSPIEILPAPGAGKYYDYVARFEHIYGGTAFTVPGGGSPYLNQGSKDYYFDRLVLTATQDAASTGTFYGFAKTNTALTLTADADATTGNGTGRLVITYTIRTIGA